MNDSTTFDLSNIATDFFDACETGKGWDVCKAFCHDNASFSCQADALASVTTLSAYCDWMKGMFGPVPNGSYELLAFAPDTKRGRVVAAAIFKGTNSGEGGPVPPTGNDVASDYAYVISFDGDKVSGMVKIWNDTLALKELGWV